MRNLVDFGKRVQCSHQWIDTKRPPIARVPMAPIVGPLRNQMKPGGEYVCRNCEAYLKVFKP